MKLFARRLLAAVRFWSQMAGLVLIAVILVLVLVAALGADSEPGSGTPPSTGASSGD